MPAQRPARPSRDRVASTSVLRRSQQLPWRLRPTRTRAAFSTSHSNPGALRSPGSLRHQLSGSPARLGGMFPAHPSQRATRSNVVGGGGGQSSRRKPGALGSFPQWPRNAEGAAASWAGPGSWGRDRSQRACKGGDGGPSWELGSPDSQGTGNRPTDSMEPCVPRRGGHGLAGSPAPWASWLPLLC